MRPQLPLLQDRFHTKKTRLRETERQRMLLRVRFFPVFLEWRATSACALHKHQRVSYPPSTTVLFSDESCSILSTQKHAKNSRLVKKSLGKNFPATESRAENATRKISKKFCCARRSTKTLLENPKRILQQQNCAQKRAQWSGATRPPSRDNPKRIFWAREEASVF